MTHDKRMHRHALLQVLGSTLVKNGPVRFFALAHILLRAQMRRTYDAHTLSILRSFHLFLFAAGVLALGWSIFTVSAVGGSAIALRLAVGSVGAGVCFAGGTWFTMPALQRARLLGEVTSSGLYGTLLALLGWIGWDTGLRLMQSDPIRFAATAAVVIGLLIAFAHPLSLLLRHRVMRLHANQYFFETPYHQLIAARPTRGQYRPIAIHEAGHALMYALGEVVPEDAIAYIDRDTLSPAVGAVSTPRVEEADITVALLEWKMHTLLAGMAAESIFTGTYGLGASGDLRGWASLAEDYLLMRRDVTYFADPVNDLQVEANKREMTALKRRTLASVSRFMLANKHVVSRIADCLEEVDYLDHAQLAGLLDGVVRTGNLPSPGWPAKLAGTPIALADRRGATAPP